MHELSIALSIVELAAEEAERRGAARIDAVRLRLGELSGAPPESLLFSYDLACEGAPLEGFSLVIEEVPVMVYCSACRIETNPPSIPRVARCRVTTRRGRQSIGSPHR